MRLPNFPCPRCDTPTVCVVTDSRRNAGGTRRTRECQGCKHRFTTQERAASGASLGLKMGQHRKRTYETKILPRYPCRDYAQH